MKKIALLMVSVMIVMIIPLQILALSENISNDFECQNHRLVLADARISYKQSIGQSDYCFKISDIFQYACIDCEYVETKETNVFKKHTHSPDSNRVCEDCKIYVR